MCFQNPANSWTDFFKQTPGDVVFFHNKRETKPLMSWSNLTLQPGSRENSFLSLVFGSKLRCTPKCWCLWIIFFYIPVSDSSSKHHTMQIFTAWSLNVKCLDADLMMFTPDFNVCSSSSPTKFHNFLYLPGNLRHTSTINQQITQQRQLVFHWSTQHWNRLWLHLLCMPLQYTDCKVIPSHCLWNGESGN